MTDVISKNKIQELNLRLKALGADESDLVEEFIRGSGSGGQKINKTNSCVQLTHVSSGIVIKCQKSRSREQNRFFAKRLLLEKLEDVKLGKKSEKAQKVHKIRAQKRRRSKRAKAKMLDGKSQRGALKKLRKPPQD